MMSARAVLIAAGAFATMQLSIPARAADQFPFRLTWSGGSSLYIRCTGP